MNALAQQALGAPGRIVGSCEAANLLTNVLNTTIAGAQKRFISMLYFFSA